MILHRLARVTENIPLAERTGRIRLNCAEIARAIRPGQFVMLRIPRNSDPLLGRPFALYDTAGDTNGEPTDLDIVFLIVGKMTSLLAQARPGDEIEIVGPLGNGFPNLAGEQVNFVAGGIGQTPFLALARQLLGARGYGGDRPSRRVDRVRMYYGVRTANLAAGVRDFEAAGCPVHLASDDGSIGHAGRVTELLETQSPEGPLVGCGPEPMLRSLARVARRWNRPCHVSLETPMACGFGACFSCVTRVRTPDGGWDYRRVCVEGPVFDATCLVDLADNEPK